MKNDSVLRSNYGGFSLFLLKKLVEVAHHGANARVCSEGCGRWDPINEADGRDGLGRTARQGQGATVEQPARQKRSEKSGAAGNDDIHTMLVRLVARQVGFGLMDRREYRSGVHRLASGGREGAGVPRGSMKL